MPGVGVGGWRTVAALTAALVAAATVADLSFNIATDHVWALVAMVVVAAVMRALGSGGAGSVLGLAAAVSVTQPILHVLGEIAHLNGSTMDYVVGEIAHLNGSTMDYVVGEIAHLAGSTTDPVGPAGLVLLVCHVVVLVVLTGIVEVGERARRTLVAGLRRVARVLVWSLTTLPEPATLDVPAEQPDLSHEQRERAPQPPRRGPPRLVVALAS